MNTPLFLVNARLSERSERGYRRYGFLFRQMFGAFTGVGAQNETDAQRLIALGCRPERVRVVGSLKYDAARLEEHRRVDVPGILTQAGRKPGAPVLVAGSTHPGEEGILADIHQRLRKQFPDLFLVLVPRHFERSRDVGKDLNTRGIPFAYRTDVVVGKSEHNGGLQCLLVNTTGELKHFYAEATVIFVGKSLTAQGGQNPIEPGALAKPMVFGPNMQNFAEITNRFLASQAAVQAKDANELEFRLTELLADANRREQMGQRARAVVVENLGAIERTVDMIVPHLQARGLYVLAKETGL